MTEPEIIILEEYQEKIITVTKEEWEYFDKTNKYYNCSLKSPISADKYEISLQAKFYIGLIKICPTLELIIKPKIKAANFIAMLQYVDEKRITTWKKFVESIEKERNFIDFFIGLFLKEVYELLTYEQKRGYNLIIENLNQPKGKILIGKTLKSRNYISKQIFCQNFKFSLNAPHNQIIKYTLNYIRFLISVDNFNLYRQNVSFLKEVDLIKWNTSQIEHISYDRLTFNYKQIHDFCRLILEDFSLYFGRGDERFFAFVINSWNVYEIFLREIYKVFQKKYEVDAYQIKGLFDDIDWDNKEILNRRPDIILKENDKVKIFIDAKYKNDFNYRDYDQMNTYITQLTRLPYGELIYPKSDDSQIDKIYGQHEKVKVRFIDLSQTTDKTYLEKFVGLTLIEYIKHL